MFSKEESQEESQEEQRGEKGRKESGRGIFDLRMEEREKKGKVVSLGQLIESSASHKQHTHKQDNKVMPDRHRTDKPTDKLRTATQPNEPPNDSQRATQPHQPQHLTCEKLEVVGVAEGTVR